MSSSQAQPYSPQVGGSDSPAASLNTARWVLVASILASSMAFIDGTVVTVALPALQNAFHASETQMQWIVESYALFLASLLLVGGSLGDRYGRLRIFSFGVTLFAIGSAWCGLAHSIHSLIVARGLQGVGAALLVPGSLALISASYPEEARGRAIGIWSGCSALTAAVGPVLGGWLVDHATWRWVFFLNVPIALAVLGLSIWKLPESLDPSVSGRLDWAGALLATLGLGGVTFALIEGKGVVVSAVAGGVLLLLLLLVESRAKSPMLPLGLFRSSTFTAANILTLFLYTALSGLLFFFPINLIQVQHYSATAAGAALLPLIVLLFLLSRWSGGLIARHGARLPLTVGPLVSALGFAMASRPGIGGSYWTTFFPAVAMLGLGMAISVAPLTTAAMNAVPVAQAGVASGVNNAFSRLAGLLGVAVFGWVLLVAFHHNLDHRLDRLSIPPSERQSIEAQRAQLAGIHTTDEATRDAVDKAFVYGFRRIVWLAALLSCAAALSAQFIKDDESNPATGS